MQLDQVVTVLRPRAPWESVDHGFSLAQRFWKPVLGSWIPLLAVVWLLVLVPLWKYPAWALLVLWWLRPVFERVPLFVLSRALFGAPPTARDTVRALPRLLSRHLISAVVLFRLSPSRSLHLPVWELEGLRGMARWRRSSILAREVGSQAAMLTFGMSFVELLVILGLSAAGSFLFPERGVDFLLINDLFTREPEARRQLFVLCGLFFLSQSLLGPFYVAGGFALYIDRRTRLEGWDIEITFRNLARRITASGSAVALVGLLLAFGGLAFEVHAQGGEGATKAPPPATAAEARARSATPTEETPELVVGRVLAHPDFATKRTVTHWVPRKSAKKKLEEADPALLSTVDGISAAWSALRPILAALLLAVFLYLLWRFARRAWQERPAGDVKAAGGVPPPRKGAVTRSEELPADIAAAGLAAWRDGQHAEALSLLYRGAVARLVLEGLPLTPASTESDCLAEVSRSCTPPRAEYVRAVVRAWQTLAYAHRTPPDDLGMKLCRDFDAIFLTRGGAA